MGTLWRRRLGMQAAWPGVNRIDERAVGVEEERVDAVQARQHGAILAGGWWCTRGAAVANPSLCYPRLDSILRLAPPAVREPDPDALVSIERCELQGRVKRADLKSGHDLPVTTHVVAVVMRVAMTRQPTAFTKLRLRVSIVASGNVLSQVGVDTDQGFP